MSQWLPVLLVVFLTALALTRAGSLHVTAASRRSWTAIIFLSGALAIAGSVWQTRKAVDNSAAPAGTTASPQTAKKEPAGQLEAGPQARTIPPEAADQLSAYLRPLGSRRVIVSCIPNDLEAYQYANQLVNILKAADWDARGPEQTKIFGDLRTPNINIFVDAADHSDTATVLLDTFAKFNIPYQSRVTPSQAIPDAETVELFVGKMQSGDVNSKAE
jgi:hypothetical protein